MDIDVDAVIRGAGGLDELAALLGLHPRRGYNAVAQWRRRRVIPPRHIVKHGSLFKRLEAKGKRIAA